MSLDSSKMNFKNKFFNNSTSTDNINKEEYLIQKDVLHMINNFVETDDIKSGTYSPYKSIKHELNSFSDDLNDKVIDIDRDNDNDSVSSNENQLNTDIKLDLPQSSPSSSQNSNYNPQINKTIPIKQTVLNNYLTFSNEELVKYALILVKDQNCCMYLQDKVSSNKKLSKSLYIALRAKIVDLMYGGFSNYFVQKLIDNLSKKHIEEIINAIIASHSFTILGLDPHGTRVIQKLIDKIKDDLHLLSMFIEPFIPSMHKFIFDPNGNHIVIKFASTIPFPHNQIVYDYLNQNIMQVSQNKNSCSALQKCIELANSEQKAKMFALIGANSPILISDDFGNYVVQFIIPICPENILNQIIASFINDIDRLSIEKSASNVIEKCLLHCKNPMIQNEIIKRYLNRNSIKNLLFNKYGNYVLQTLFSVAQEPYRTTLANLVYVIKESDKKLNKKTINKVFKGVPYLKKKLENCSPKNNKYPQSKINNNSGGGGVMNSNINSNYYYNGYNNKSQQGNYPMNINIAINNYYSNPIYNYYCFQRQYPQMNGVQMQNGTFNRNSINNNNLFNY